MATKRKHLRARPSPNGGNGDRDGRGRFLPGNPGGPGNPRAGDVNTWRAALADAVSAEDLRAVIARLVREAKKGKAWAIELLLDRTLGKSMQPIEVADTTPRPIALPDDLPEYLDFRAAQAGGKALPR